MSKQIRIDPATAKAFGLKVKPNEPGRNSARYRVPEELAKEIQAARKQPRKRKYKTTIKRLDKNGAVISTVEKLQSKPLEVPDNFEIIKISTNQTTGQQWIQYAPVSEPAKDIDFKAIISKHIKPVKIKPVPTNKIKFDFQVLTISDLHVGLDPDKYKNSLYPAEWNLKEIMATAKHIINKVKQHRRSATLVIDDLGDLLDGYNAKTTRGGHELPQNMTNEQAFDTALSFKMYLLDHLAPLFTKIIINNICNDNHAGSFGYFVNSAFAQIAKQKYNIEVTNHRRFISHYFVNGICFVITHGKDDKDLRNGLKVKPGADTIEKIDQYLKSRDIYKTAKLIVFKKGDSHQALFDMCSSDDFYYFNYPALSPSSQWVQSNFKRGRRGYILEGYSGTEVSIKPFFV